MNRGYFGDRVWVNYETMRNKLKYKLGLVIVNACNSAPTDDEPYLGPDARTLAHGIFSGHGGTLYPFLSKWTDVSEVLAPGVQGTRP